MTRFLLLTYCILSSFSYSQGGDRLFAIPGTEIIQIEDNRNGRSYDLYVKVPASYWRPENRGKNYPVIYITDARVNFPIMEASTLYSMNTGSMQEIVLVGISWQKGISVNASRIRDFTPTVDESWRERSGGARNFLAFLTAQVFPLVENRYRIDANNRTYAGNSLGGLFGAFVLLQRPETFRQYILGSPSLFYDHKYILRLEASGAAVQPKRDTRVFIAVGEYENPEDAGIRSNLLADAAEFSARLENWDLENLEVKFLEIPQAFHEMAFPTTAIHGAFWLFKQ